LFERRTPPPRLSVLEPGRQAARRRRRLPLLVPVAFALAVTGAAFVVLGTFY
jgi:hypothetical protein